MRCRNLLLCGILSLLSLGASASTAHAQLFGLGGVVYDPRNFAQNVLLYKRAYDQLVTAKQQVQAQLTALKKLTNPNWRDITGTLRQMDALLRQSQTLGVGMAQLDAEFRALFPGTVIAGDASAIMRTQSHRSLATFRAVLDATGQASQSIPDGLARLQAMKRQLASVDGHQAVLELGTTIDTYAAEELTLLRQQLAALVNAEAVYYTHQVNREAQARASEQALWAWFARPSRVGRTISYRPE